MPKFKIKNSKDPRIEIRVKLGRGEFLAERILSLVTGKTPRGLLKATVLRKNLIQYIGPRAVSLLEFMRQPRSSYDFFYIIAQIILTERRIAENYATEKQLVLELQYVFINPSTRELQFIFLPLTKEQSNSTVFELMEQIANSWNIMTGGDMQYVSRFSAFLYHLKAYDPDRILGYIKHEDAAVAQMLQRGYVTNSGFITNKRADYYKHYEKKALSPRGSEPDAASLLRGQNAHGWARDDETSLLAQENSAVSREDETSLLSLTGDYRSENRGRASLDDEPQTSLLSEGGSGRHMQRDIAMPPNQFISGANSAFIPRQSEDVRPMQGCAWQSSVKNGYNELMHENDQAVQEDDTSLLGLDTRGMYGQTDISMQSSFGKRDVDARSAQIWQDDEATGLLQENRAQKYPYLIRRSNGERIPVDKPVFRIGKERSYVDYFVSNNHAISRSHADIICRNGRYYICDRNSTNKTYCNGRMLIPEDEVQIVNGDLLQLANEEFEFCDER